MITHIIKFLSTQFASCPLDGMPKPKMRYAK